jgi:hypothetical protein
MTIDRRSLIKDMALLGIASPFLGGALPALATAGLPAPALSTSILVSAGATDSAFVQGARAGIGAPMGQVCQASHELAFMQDFEQRLHRDQAVRIIGLLDDALATPLLALARSAGASVPWLGQHTATAGLSRHRVLTAGMADGCVGHLHRQLLACGTGFTLNEERHGCAVPAPQLAGVSRSREHLDQWAVAIGFLLASMGRGNPGAPPVFAAGTEPLIGSFVSFSIVA